MTLNILLTLLTIPIIALALSIGMVLLKKIGTVLGGLVWLILWGIPMISLVAMKRIALVDVMINLIFYLIVSAIMLFLVYKTSILLGEMWLKQFMTYKTSIALVENCLDSVNIPESQKPKILPREGEQVSNSGESHSNNFAMGREIIDRKLLTDSPGDPNLLFRWFIEQGEEQEEWAYVSIAV